MLQGPGVLPNVTCSQWKANARPRGSPHPLPAGHPSWQKSLFPVGGQGCVYSTINREQRKWLRWSLWQLLGARIPSLALVLLTPGLGVGQWDGGPSPPSLHSGLHLLRPGRQLWHLGLFSKRCKGQSTAKNRPPGPLRSGVTSTDSPLLTEGAPGTPTDQRILATRVSDNNPYWFYVAPSSKWGPCPCARHGEKADPPTNESREF